MKAYNDDNVTPTLCNRKSA